MDPDSQDELTRFRQQWIEEVTATTTTNTTSHQQQQQPPTRNPLEDSALLIYARAVYYERNGLLDNALHDYRTALRQQPNVDRAYYNLTIQDIYALESHWDSTAPFQFRHQQSASSSSSSSLDNNEPPAAQSNLDLDSSSITGSTKSFLNYLLTSFRNHPWQRNPPEPVAEGDGTTEATSQDDDELTQHLSKLQIEGRIQEEEEETGRRRLVFEAAEISAGCGMQRLPVEVIEHTILSVAGYDRATIHLLVTSIERFGRVCRLARVLTLRAPVWRHICAIIYAHDLAVNQPPNPIPLRIPSIAKSAHALDWRRMFIYQPRLRLDGCYISLVRYPRLGESANPWYTPTHFVTYYRYLRFLQDGRCVSFTSTDEPRLVVRSLGWGATSSSSTSGEPAAAARPLPGLLFGLWSLDHDRVRLFRLHQDPNHPASFQSSSPSSSSSSSSNPLLSHPVVGRAAYEFEIRAKLSSTRRGKMNKLEVESLATTNLVSGEVCQVPLCPAWSSSAAGAEEGQTQEGSCGPSKPYIFSRVVSYDPV